MNTIKFSHDWNGKLSGATWFTTIRQSCPAKYIQGRAYTILKNEIPLFEAECESVTTMPLRHFKPVLLILDTGCSYTSALEVFRRMGKFETLNDCLNADYDLILLKRLK
jgi:hypothetical protein